MDRLHEALAREMAAGGGPTGRAVGLMTEAGPAVAEALDRLKAAIGDGVSGEHDDARRRLTECRCALDKALSLAKRAGLLLDDAQRAAGKPFRP